MINVGTVLKVSDNSGVLVAECIHVYGGYKKSYASVGDIIMVSSKRVVPNSKVKKGEKFLGVVIRTKSEISRKDGSNVSFSDNSVVLINKQGELISTRVFGPVSRELRSNPIFLKIISLASEVI